MMLSAAFLSTPSAEAFGGLQQGRINARTLPAMFLNPVRHITADAHDPLAPDRFFAEVTGYAVEDEAEGNEFCVECSAGERGLTGA